VARRVLELLSTSRTEQKTARRSEKKIKKKTRRESKCQEAGRGGNVNMETNGWEGEKGKKVTARQIGVVDTPSSGIYRPLLLMFPSSVPDSGPDNAIAPSLCPCDVQRNYVVCKMRSCRNTETGKCDRQWFILPTVLKVPHKRAAQIFLLLRQTACRKANGRRLFTS
jgi:hypothetical protein